MYSKWYFEFAVWVLVVRSSKCYITLLIINTVLNAELIRRHVTQCIWVVPNNVKKAAKMTEALSSVPPLTTFFGRIPSQTPTCLVRKKNWTNVTLNVGLMMRLSTTKLHSQKTLSQSLLTHYCWLVVPIRSLDNSVISDNPAEWIPDDKLCEKLASRPIKQNIGDFSRSQRAGKTQKRYMPPSLFCCQMANGELIKREWLVYSPSTGNVFCQPCMLT